ncbi:hypothetical protein BD410DRAFT_365553 [Rickenella mellea]|uniref:Uncharacterized protein n=1 Tax=Rickenella mellea TaxID=50990 RepID=A0A4Y7PFD5_9AGAM|nr:hypothetical protein BD410DRAFT_365553 [Rickenella mellea]
MQRAQAPFRGRQPPPAIVDNTSLAPMVVDRPPMYLRDGSYWWTNWPESPPASSPDAISAAFSMTSMVRLTTPKKPSLPSSRWTKTSTRQTKYYSAAA